ncbi:MAG: putative transport system ATP-binding protein [Solirubrobacteraceae bacterium]|jgi:putative ABC transport system ATP-binding protein|nr:putative transport system ATP-binding protein [Solirubrobacteraceae bacterium]MDX6673316.1 putative transport system ATP-binding protein [Solirubrobacteraceae bacterium]
MDTTTLYELEGVGRRYGQGATEVRALEGMDLRIASGEFVVVAGPSGSGKTTLLQLLGALDRPTDGVVRFEGRDLRGLGDGELARLRLSELGFVFQQFNLIPTLTARQNVEAALAPTGVDASARHLRAGELLEAVGLAARSEHLPSQLSGGEQQRVAIARALANDPRVLLADEPTGNLDTTTGREILALLRQLADGRGLTIVVVTHDPAIADDAPRVVHMRDGHQVAADELVAAQPAATS